MKRKVYEDQQAVHEFNTKLMDTRNALQGATSQFNRITGHCPSIDELRACFDKKGKFSPDLLREVVLMRLYPDAETEVHGIRLNRAQLHKVVEVPDLSELGATLQLLQTLFPGESFWSYFSIDETRLEVRAISARVDAYLDNFRVYAVTGGELERLEQAHTVAGIYNSMVKESGIDPARLAIPGFLFWNEFGGFAPDPHYVKNSTLINT